MEKDAPQFEEYVREQLYSGVDGDENPLIPGYTEDPYFKKTYGEHWKKNAERYKNWKTKIQKPKPSYLGFSARGNNTPNLIIRGDFYSSITAIPISNGIRIASYGVSFGSDIEKKYGYKIAILSGGFTYFGQYLQKKYGIDYVYANELEIVDGKLTGRYLGDVVDGKRKAELLRLIAQVEKVDIAQTIAVGDGANDLPMLGIAGLGIAFHAKPKVVANAKQSINTIGLDGVLYFLGFKDSYLNM